MITITEGLYLHMTTNVVIVSDQKQQPRHLHIRGKVMIAADNITRTKRLFRAWLADCELEEIARTLRMSRSNAHRLRTAMGINPRGAYAK